MDPTVPPTSTGDPRVRFAAERTLLAWIRTGIALMGFGFVVARFGWFLRELAARDPETIRPNGWSLAIGVGLIVLGGIVNVAAGIEHKRFLSRFDRGEAYIKCQIGRWVSSWLFCSPWQGSSWRFT